MTKWTRTSRQLFILATLCLWTLSAGEAQAIGLDEISQQSGLGEPLRVVIPVIAADQVSDDDFPGECFKVVPAAANDVPQLSMARLALERRNGLTLVVLTTAYPIQEPIMRVAVQAGCRVSVTREYTLLFDPVAIERPAIEAGKIAPLSQRPSAGVAEAPAEGSVLPALSSIPEEAPKMQRSHASKRPSRSGSRARSKIGSGATVQTPAWTGAPTLASGKRISNAPRLQISRAIGEGVALPAVMNRKAAAERQALMAIEEQTVVLQRQIAELSLAMERVQEELNAARAARAQAERIARAATERAAAATPSSMLFGWVKENRLFLLLASTLAILIAALLVRRGRKCPTIPAPFTVTQAEAFNPADLGEPSIPGPDTMHDEEALVASIKATYRQHMRRPFVANSRESRELKSADQDYDADSSFDDEVLKTATESSALSALEREEPRIVARLAQRWGAAKVIAQLENYLLIPRRGDRSLSRGAVEELKLLRSIAMEHGDESGPRKMAGVSSKS